MIGYFCESPGGRHCFYIPYNLLAVEYVEEFKFHSNKLDRIAEHIRNHNVTLDSLAESGWEVCEVPIDDKSLKRLRKSFFTKRYFRPEQIALKLLEKALEYVDFFGDEGEHSMEKPKYDTGNTYDDGFPNEDPEDDEDREDSWWRSGD